MASICRACGFAELSERPRAPESGPSYEIGSWRAFELGFESSERPEYETSTCRGERGGSTLEYVGMLIFAAVIVLALLGVAPSIAARMTSRVSSAVSSVLGGGGPATGSGSPAGTGGSAGGQVGPGVASPGAGTSGGSGGSGSTGPSGATGGSGLPGGQGSAPDSANLAAQVDDAAANAQRLVAAGGNGWGNPNTLAKHFRDHGGDFSSPGEQAYAQEAQQFLQRAVSGHLPTKIGADGTIRVYDPATNTFGAYNPDGTTKTYFKPDLANNPNYWVDQPGQDPWSSPPSEGAPSGGGGAPGGGPPNGNGGEPGGGAPAPERAPAPDPPPAPEPPPVEIPPIEIPIIP